MTDFHEPDAVNESDLAIDTDIIRDRLEKRFPNSGSKFIESHIAILDYLRQQKAATMNELAKELRYRHNYVHLRLKHLLEIGVLKREKQARGFSATGRKVSEFVYSLSPEKPDTAELLEELLDLNNTDEEESTVSEFNSKQPSTPQKQVLSIPRLPDYDPSWSEEIKAEWFRLYSQLLEIQKKNI